MGNVTIGKEISEDKLENYFWQSVDVTNRTEGLTDLEGIVFNNTLDLGFKHLFVDLHI